MWKMILRCTDNGPGPTLGGEGRKLGIVGECELYSKR